MRTLKDDIIDNIRLHSQSHQEKPTERYFTTTSMPAPGENELHGTFFPNTAGPSCQIYEIIMVSLGGSILLLSMLIIALKAIRKRVLRVQSQGKLSGPCKGLAAPETVVATVVAKHDGDQIFTAQVDGPAYISYISDIEAPPVPDPEGKPDSNMMLPFSFTSSISPFDKSPKQ